MSTNPQPQMSQSATNLTTGSDNIEEIPNDTLIALLKEKAKELKVLQTKIKKVEERYVEVFKEKKNLVKDRETFEGVIKLVFPKHICDDILTSEFGLYDIEQIQKLWSLIKEQTNTDTSSLIDSLKEEKVHLADKIKDLTSVEDDNTKHRGRIKELEDENKELMKVNAKLKQTEKELEHFKKENELNKKKLEEVNRIKHESSSDLNASNARIASLEGLLQEKDKQIEAMRVLEEENTTLKAQSLLDVFKSTRSVSANNGGAEDHTLTSKLKLKISEQENEILKLRDIITETGQKVIDLNGQIAAFEQQKESTNEKEIHEHQVQLKEEEITKLKHELEELQTKHEKLGIEYQQSRKKAQRMLLEKDSDIEKLKEKNIKLDSELKTIHSQLYTSMHSENTNGKSRSPSHSDTKLGNYHTNDKHSSAHVVAGAKLDEKQLKISYLENKIGELQQIIDSKSEMDSVFEKRIHELERSKTRENVNLEYLKNILVKYLQYTASNDYKEAQILEKVLYTILQLSADEIKEIDKIREESNSIWSYFTAKKKIAGLSRTNSIHTPGSNTRQNTIAHSTFSRGSSQYNMAHEERKTIERRASLNGDEVLMNKHGNDSIFE